MPLLTNYPRFSPSSHFNSIPLHTLNTSANIPPINSSSYSYTLLIYTPSPLNHFHSFSIPVVWSIYVCMSVVFFHNTILRVLPI